MRSSDRGMILAVTMMMALVASIVAYGVMQLAVSQGRQGRFFRSQTSARYLAEAGMVVAQLRLLEDQENPGPDIWFCTNPTPMQIDTNGNGIDASDPIVDVTVTPGCPRTANTNATISVRIRN